MKGRFVRLEYNRQWGHTFDIDKNSTWPTRIYVKIVKRGHKEHIKKGNVLKSENCSDLHNLRIIQKWSTWCREYFSFFMDK